jgi:hypothetical protein
MPARTKEHEVGAEEEAEAGGEDQPDAGRDPLVHEPDREGVGHREAADEAAGFSCEG